MSLAAERANLRSLSCSYARYIVDSLSERLFLSQHAAGQGSPGPALWTEIVVVAAAAAAAAAAALVTAAAACGE